MYIDIFAVTEVLSFVVFGASNLVVSLVIWGVRTLGAQLELAGHHPLVEVVMEKDEPLSMLFR